LRCPVSLFQNRPQALRGAKKPAKAQEQTDGRSADGRAGEHIDQPVVSAPHHHGTYIIGNLRPCQQLLCDVRETR